MAETVVVASIVEYKAGPGAPPPSGPADPYQVVFRGIFRQAGEYRLQIIEPLKGKCDDHEIDLQLPLLTAYYFGGSKFELAAGSRVLLLLKQGADKKWELIDPLLSLVPISTPNAPLDTRKTKQASPLEVILASLEDPSLRPALSYLLQEVKGEAVNAAMRSYVDDKDPKVQANVLYCMAVNQDVAAIPKIAALDQAGKTPVRLDGLGRYTKPEAVKFLNSIVVTGSDLARLNAMNSLRKIADESSIPYLIQALDRDDAQHTVSYGAYWTLHRLIGPSIGEVQPNTYFQQHRDAEIAPLKQWWEWEQLKQKKAAATQAMSQPAYSQPAGQTPTR